MNLYSLYMMYIVTDTAIFTTPLDSSYTFHEIYLVFHSVKSTGFVDTGFTCALPQFSSLKYSALLSVLASEDVKSSFFFERWLYTAIACMMMRESII